MGLSGSPAISVPDAGEWVTGLWESSPELVVGAVLATVLVILAVVVLLRRRGRTPSEALIRVLARQDEVAILMHPNPDPDAMGAAVGVKELVASQGGDATIYYPGQIRHQQNRAFQTVLDLDFEQVETPNDIAEDTLVLVDHNTPRGFTNAEGMTADVVIDHHPGSGAGQQFTDVRPEYGACATIVAEYFEALGAKPPGVDEEDGGVPPRTPQLTSTVATALMYGIQADTDHLTRGCTAAEFEASAYLYPATDENLLHRIANPQVTTEVLETKAAAITEHVVNGSFAVADVGEINDVDAIPQASDELVRLEGISAVVVYGSKEGTIHLSGRSSDDRVHMGRTLEAVFEPIPMASAGGHARMGGGQVPLTYLAGIGPSGVDEERARGDLRGRLFDAMKGNV